VARINGEYVRIGGAVANHFTVLRIDAREVVLRTANENDGEFFLTMGK
jgi:hypothetical protein